MKLLQKVSIVAASLTLGIIAPMVGAADATTAKVTQAAARATALARVPGGTVQSAELEHENGKHVWSFDIKDPKSANVIEVQVEASTGRIVSQKVETPAEQAKEAEADLKAKK